MAGQKSIAKNHHEIPKLYLEGFSDDGSFLWVYRRGKPYKPTLRSRSGNPYRSGVHETTRQKNRYAHTTPQGVFEPDRVESQLQKIEHSSDEIMRKIRAKEPISSDEKGKFAEYIQLTHKRTSKRDTAARGQLNQIVNSVPWSQRGFELAANGHFAAARRLYETEQYLKSEDGGQRYILNESRLKNYDGFHAALLAKNWTFYVAPSDAYFVTLDTPVFFDESIGLRNGPLFFSISKDVFMFASSSRPDDLQYPDATRDEVLTLNYIMICNGREIYSPRCDQRIWELLHEGFRPQGNETLVLTQFFA